MNECISANGVRKKQKTAVAKYKQEVAEDALYAYGESRNGDDPGAGYL